MAVGCTKADLSITYQASRLRAHIIVASQTTFVGEAVVEAIRQGKPLEDLPLDELQKFSPVIDEDVYPILSLQSCPDKRAQ